MTGIHTNKIVATSVLFLCTLALVQVTARGSAGAESQQKNCAWTKSDTSNVKNDIGTLQSELSADSGARPLMGPAAKAAANSPDAAAAFLRQALKETLAFATAKDKVANDASATESAINKAKEAARKARKNAKELRQLLKKLGPENRLDIDSDRTKITVRLAKAPTSRLRVSFDTGNGGHKELEWDPAADTGLMQSVLLSQGTWFVAASAEEKRYSANGVLLLTNQEFTSRVSAGQLILEGETKAMSTTSTSTATAETLSGWPSSTLYFRCQSGKTTMAASTEDFSFPSESSDKRGFSDSTIPAGVSEVFSIIAEFALDKAKSKGLALVKKKLVDPACAIDETKLSLKNLGLHASDDSLAFPRSCQLVSSLRLEEILTSGNSLLSAIKKDLRLSILPAAIAKIFASGTGSDTGTAIASALPKAVLRAIVSLDSGDNYRRVIEEFVLSVDVLQWGQLMNSQLASIFSDPKDIFTTSILTSLEKLSEVQTKAWQKSFATHLPNQCTEPKVTWKECSAELVKLFKESKTPLQLAKKLGLDTVIRAELDGLPRKVLSTLPNLQSSLTTSISTSLGKLVQQKAWQKSFATHLPKQCTEPKVVWGKCSRELVKLFNDSKTPLQLAKKLGLDTVIRAALDTELGGLLTFNKYIEAACTTRLAVTIAKTCNNGGCTASELIVLGTNPDSVFSQDSDNPIEAVCWKADGSYRLPAKWLNNRDILLRTAKLLDPIDEGKERERLVELVSYSKDMALDLLILGTDGDSRSNRNKVQAISDTLIALIERDYPAALASAVVLVEEILPEDKKLPKSLRKFVQLVGSVASYLQVYKATKNDSPEDARAARKRALESIIESATNRTGREDEWIVSLATSPGYSFYHQKIRDSENNGELKKGVGGNGLRFPLGISVQKLGDQKERLKGVHFMATIADLGNFVSQNKDGEQSDITWSDFVSPGIEFGVLFGPDASFLISAGVSWAPSLFPIEVGTGTNTKDVSGALRYGLSLSYYVPLFDLN